MSAEKNSGFKNGGSCIFSPQVRRFTFGDMIWTSSWRSPRLSNPPVFMNVNQEEQTAMSSRVESSQWQGKPEELIKSTLTLNSDRRMKTSDGRSRERNGNLILSCGFAETNAAQKLSSPRTPLAGPKLNSPNCANSEKLKAQWNKGRAQNLTSAKQCSKSISEWPSNRRRQIGGLTVFCESDNQIKKYRISRQRPKQEPQAQRIVCLKERQFGRRSRPEQGVLNTTDTLVFDSSLGRNRGSSVASNQIKHVLASEYETTGLRFYDNPNASNHYFHSNVLETNAANQTWSSPPKEDMAVLGKYQTTPKTTKQRPSNVSGAFGPDSKETKQLSDSSFTKGFRSSYSRNKDKGKACLYQHNSKARRDCLSATRRLSPTASDQKQRMIQAFGNELISTFNSLKSKDQPKAMRQFSIPGKSRAKVDENLVNSKLDLQQNERADCHLQVEAVREQLYGRALKDAFTKQRKFVGRISHRQKKGLIEGIVAQKKPIQPNFRTALSKDETGGAASEEVFRDESVGHLTLRLRDALMQNLNKLGKKMSKQSVDKKVKAIKEEIEERRVVRELRQRERRQHDNSTEHSFVSEEIWSEKFSSDPSDDQERDCANARELFLKSIEKEFLIKQKIKGYNQALEKAKARSEQQRHPVLIKFLRKGMKANERREFLAQKLEQEIQSLEVHQRRGSDSATTHVEAFSAGDDFQTFFSTKQNPSGKADDYRRQNQIQNKETERKRRFSKTNVRSHQDRSGPEKKEKAAQDNLLKKKVREKEEAQLSSLIQKVKLGELSKRVHSGPQTGLDRIPDFLFLTQCLQSQNSLLPILNKVENESLVLEDYVLQKGHVSGLASSIGHLKQPVIKNMLLSNCQLSDEMIGELLQGCAISENLRKLILKRGSIMNESVESLCKLISIAPLSHLRELRLVNCNTTPFHMDRLIKNLESKEHSFISSLALVQMKIDFPLDDLARFVEKTASLEDLDLTGNHLKHVHFAPLMLALARHRELKTLNLSYNSLLARTDWEVPYDFFVQPPALRQMDNSRQLIQRESLADIKPSQMPQLVVESLGNMIRYNKNIQSINVECTGLNSFVLMHLVPYLRHAKSLLCFHLDQNPGIFEQVEEYWKSKLAVGPSESEITIDVKQERDDLKRHLTLNEKIRMTEQEQQVRNFKAENYRRWCREEAAAVAHMRVKKRLFERQEVRTLSAYKNSLSICRKLGHKNIQPGTGQWQMSKKLIDKQNCWYCGNWIFTVVFWNEDFGILNEKLNVGIEDDEKARLIDLIRQNDPRYQENESVPLLFSNCTNWQGKPFMRISEFVIRASNISNQSAMAMEMAKEKFQFTDLESLTPQMKDRVLKFQKAKTDEMIAELQQDALENPLELISTKNLRYTQILKINLEKVSDPNKTFVLPIFIKPGRTHFVLRTPRDVTESGQSGESAKLLRYQRPSDSSFRFYYNRRIIPIREERVPQCKYRPPRDYHHLCMSRRQNAASKQKAAQIRQKQVSVR